jgi:hypothetical protein
MIQFQGFKPDAQKRIAGKLGYTGDMSNFDGYLEQNPEAKKQMDMYKQQAVKMMQGGMVRKNYQEGGTVPQIKKDTIDRMATGAVPAGGEVKAVGTEADMMNKGVQLGLSQVTSDDPRANQTQAVASTTDISDEDEVRIQTPSTVATTDLAKAGDTVDDVVDKTKAQTGTVTKKVDAQETKNTMVSDLEAAQSKSVEVAETQKRVMDIKEEVNPVANAESAAKFTEEIQAATATPTDKATVQGQLEDLMQDFEGGATPPWAAGAMRNVSAQMAARGLGASSMAGMALVQAAMESSLPIAMADAQTVAGFEMANLSNRQARAMQSAEQRAKFLGQEFDQSFQARVMNAAKVSDIANMNFTAEQTIAIENSRAANTMEMSNLSNKQGLIMAEAAALSQLDMANLNNRQQTQVENAKSFLAMDMANLSNKQQTELFKGQERSKALFSDTAAENAALQFNATSENQADQFFVNLKTQNNQFNDAQKNAIEQANAGEANALSKFNSEIQNQRDQFNANNALVVAQSNAGWRREIATAETAAINRANEINATNVLGISNQAYSNLWQEQGDLMEWAWESAEGERNRQNAVTLSHLAADSARSQAEMEADLASSALIGDFATKVTVAALGGGFLGE